MHANNGAKQSFTFGTKIKVKEEIQWGYIWWFELNWTSFKNNEETIAKFISRTYKETAINRFEMYFKVNHGQIGIFILNNNEIDEKLLSQLGMKLR